jgi:hypothetical protein
MISVNVASLCFLAAGGAAAGIPLKKPHDPSTSSCDHVQTGYQCRPEISHFWGQYSAFFSVPSKIPSEVPPSCDITFAQLLSRHGARNPTASKTVEYEALVTRIKKNVQSFEGPYDFLNDYEYTLGADDLTVFGQQQMVNSGLKFFDQYEHLAAKHVPFVRASGEDRVVESAKNWTQGYHEARIASGRPDVHYPYNILTIIEDDQHNNTLDHGTCTNFEDGPLSEIGDNAQDIWTQIFVPPIQKRLNRDLPGANLTQGDVIYFMDLCPFNTMASRTGQISPFCDLFSEAEWHQYDYYESLGKWYGYGPGNPLGPTQGVGFTNELIARLTEKPVQDETSSNHTLDSKPKTFPLHRLLYADFSHDNGMTSVFSALGLYNGTKPLSNTTLESVQQTHGYSASWATPFGARMVVEKMECAGSYGELVRVLVNDRVIPLETCGADHLGRCQLEKFVKSLSFAQGNGHWDQCFT